MTKQEQIDELAKAIYENYDCDGMRDGFCRGCGLLGEEMCISRLCAKRLYNAGYHKNDTSTFHTYSDSVLQKQTKQWLIERIRELEQAHLDDELQLNKQRENFQKLLEEVKRKCERDVEE